MPDLPYTTRPITARVTPQKGNHNRGENYYVLDVIAYDMILRFRLSVAGYGGMLVELLDGGADTIEAPEDHPMAQALLTRIAEAINAGGAAQATPQGRGVLEYRDTYHAQPHAPDAGRVWEGMEMEATPRSPLLNLIDAHTRRLINVATKPEQIGDWLLLCGYRLVGVGGPNDTDYLVEKLPHGDDTDPA